MLWFAIAHAQEPAEAEEPPAEPYEVIVYGELLVEQARAAVIEQLHDLGYDAEVVDRGDHVVYRHAQAWYGEVVLYDDGWMQVKRQALRVEGHPIGPVKKDSPVAWAGCLVWPWLCLRTSGATYGTRKWRSRETMTVDSVHEKVQTYADRVADLATSRKVDSLPDRLAALWDDGVPLVAGPSLPTPEDRRRALYDYWASRTDTPWGRDVQAAVEAFCRGVVQHSDHPFTADELARLSSPERPFLP